jgi:hypothetical protein
MVVEAGHGQQPQDGPGGHATTKCTPLELSSSLARTSAARAVESMKLMVAVDRVSEDYSF